MKSKILLVAAVLSLATSVLADGGPGNGNRKWVASWTTAPQNIFAGVGATQTAALVNFAFPAATGRQAINQTRA